VAEKVPWLLELFFGLRVGTPQKRVFSESCKQFIKFGIGEAFQVGRMAHWKEKHPGLGK
jgi:hypothetical protein